MFNSLTKEKKVKMSFTLYSLVTDYSVIKDLMKGSTGNIEKGDVGVGKEKRV